MTVSSHIFLGALIAWITDYIGIGAAFSIAYRTHRKEPEYLAFGLLCFCLAFFAGGVCLAYIAGDGSAALGAGLTLASFGLVASSAVLLHFALLFAKVEGTRRVMRPIYALATVLCCVDVSGGFFARVGTDYQPASIFGWSFDQANVSLTWVGTVAVVYMCSCALLAWRLVARACFNGRIEGMAPLGGSTVLCLSWLHDGALAAHWLRSPWLSPYGSIAFVFSVAGTLTVRYSFLSRELEQSSLELRRSYDSLQDAQKELSRRDQLAAVGELAAVIAHEVRNPLAIITNAIAGLRREQINAADRATLLEILGEESIRLDRLVSDLLRYAKPLNLQLQLVSVSEILSRALYLARDRSSLIIDYDSATDVPSVWADPHLLRQLFENLIENALQAMDYRGTLSIALLSEARRNEKGTAVVIADNGKGMDANVKRRAKDPFFTTRPSGTGLGLAIVDRILEAHGGEMTIESESGAGTRVTVFLPATAAGQLPQSLPPRGSDDGAFGGRLRSRRRAEP